MNETVIAVLAAAGIPSAITSFGLWIIQHKISKREAGREQEEQERIKKREKHEVLLIQSVNAAISLGEATAKVVQQISDEHCNDDINIALAYAAKVKHEQKDFLIRQGLGSLQD